MPAAVSRVIVSSEIDLELSRWLDLHLAEKRLELLKAGREDALIPTRSSYLRNLIIQDRATKRNGNTKK